MTVALYTHVDMLDHRPGARHPERPERLRAAYFGGSDPEEMLIDEVEAIWAPIAERDDWTAFHAKLAAVAEAERAWAFD